jgi:hypothetical protein
MVSKQGHALLLLLQATGKRLVWVSRIGVLAWAIFMGVIMCIAQICNLNVNWCVLHCASMPAQRLSRSAATLLLLMNRARFYKALRLAGQALLIKRPVAGLTGCC